MISSILLVAALTADFLCEVLDWTHDLGPQPAAFKDGNLFLTKRDSYPVAFLEKFQ